MTDSIAAILAQTQPVVPPDGAASCMWSDLLRLNIENGGLVFRIGPVLWILLPVAAIVAGIWILRRGRYSLKGDLASVKLKFGNFAEAEIRPNRETVRIAYQAWVEIMTRKVGLPFDEEHDVIVEVYNSWHTLFGVLRELAKTIPAHQLRRDKDTRRLVSVIMAVLNKGLRPHLTKYQARFRSAYEAAKAADANRNKTPQEIQRGCPGYEDLVTDLKGVNAAFVEFAGALQVLAQGDRTAGN